eukprot:SAG22_NODE_7393_length_744_cov_0.953488_1_plen_85_part_10
MEQMFQEVDKDGSGSVDFKEFKAWFVQQELQDQQRVSKKQPAAKEEDSKMRQVWLGADADGSGSLDKGELQQVLVEMGFAEERLR